MLGKVSQCLQCTQHVPTEIQVPSPPVQRGADRRLRTTEHKLRPHLEGHCSQPGGLPMTGTSRSRLARCHRSRPSRRRTPSSGDSPATTTTLFPLPIPPFNMFKSTRPTAFILPSHRSACPPFSHDHPLSLYHTSFFHLSLRPPQRIRTPRNAQAIRPSDRVTPRSRPRLTDYRKRSTVREKWMLTERCPSTHDLQAIGGQEEGRG